MFQDIKQMHKHYNRNYEGRPRPLPPKEDELRIKLLREELAEYEEAVTLEDKLDALVDLVVVALGAAELHGFDFDEAWRRVLSANMKKLVATTPEQSKRGVVGDLYKPEGWTPPNLKDLVE